MNPNKAPIVPAPIIAPMFTGPPETS